jgi:acylphosphatase
MKRVHLMISGKVQGVNFRYYTNIKAENLGLKGWVRNTGDERVEILVEGEEKGVDEFVAWCHRGPSLARVENVVVEEEVYKGDLGDFQVRRSLVT